MTSPLTSFTFVFERRIGDPLGSVEEAARRVVRAERAITLEGGVLEVVDGFEPLADPWYPSSRARGRLATSAGWTAARTSSSCSRHGHKTRHDLSSGPPHYTPNAGPVDACAVTSHSRIKAPTRSCCVCPQHTSCATPFASHRARRDADRRCRSTLLGRSDRFRRCSMSTMTGTTIGSAAVDGKSVAGLGADRVL